jgi:hypothetical protein
MMKRPFAFQRMAQTEENKYVPHIIGHPLPIYEV